MALTVDTTTIPGYTIITDGTGGIAVLPTPPEDSTAPSYTIQNEIVDKLDIISFQLEKISKSFQSLENISDSLIKIEEHQKTMKNLASGQGINFKGPYEWLSMSSLLRLYQEQKVDIQKLKEEFDRIVPKDF